MRALSIVIIGVLCSVCTADMGTRSRVRIKKSSELIVNNNDSTDYTLEKMAVLAQKRRALIEDIRRFLREAQSENQKAELNLRLGALYMEDYHAAVAQAQEKYEAQIRSTPNSQTPLDTSEAKIALGRAISLYKTLLAKNPDHPRRDEMMYFLAVASLDNANTQSAMAYFMRLTQQAPKSRFVAEAWLHLADYYFDKNQAAQAQKYYDAIIRAKNQQLFAYAVYKKAWCLYNQQQFALAIKHFKWVASSSNPEAVRVKKEALRDIILPFVELNKIDEAVSFYKAQDKDAYRSGLEAMTLMLRERGKHATSISLYAMLIDLDPNHRSNPQYELGIIESLRLSNRTQAAIERLFSRLPLYTESSSWYEINSSSPVIIKECTSNFEETARKYALQYHAEGQSTKNATLYETAKSLYTKYLEHFPLATAAPKIRFYLAEILFKQELYLEAYEHYYKVYKTPSAASLHIDSLRYSLSSLARAVNFDRTKRGLTTIGKSVTQQLKASDNETQELLPFSKTESQFFSVGDEYITRYASQKDVADVLYEQSYLRYIHHDFSLAHKGFWSLIQRFPKHVNARASAYLILDILNRKSEYDGLIGVCKTFLGHRDMNTPSFRTNVAGVLRQAELKRISLLEDKGRYEDAASQYLEFTKAYGAQDEALFEKALYNASVNFTKANQLLQAVNSQERFLRRFPKSALRQNMLLQVARMHEMLANFDKAALFFEEFSRAYLSHPQAQTAFRLAALYYWGAGQANKAETILNEYRTRFPQDEKTAVRDLVDIYESSGLTAKQTKFYIDQRAKKHISASEYLDYSHKIAALQSQQKGKPSLSLKKDIARVATQFRNDLIKTPQGAQELSRYLFSEVAALDRQFHRMRISGKKMEQLLKAKMAMLHKLDSQYTAITKIGSAQWGLASMYRTASAYQQMAEEIAQAPVPAELTSEQVDIYRAELEKEMISPLREKAKLLSKTCLEKSTELNILSQWVPRCYDLASGLESSTYPVARTFYLPPLHFAIALPSNGLGAIKRFNYPYYSTFLFDPPQSVRNASSDSIEENSTNTPIAFDYQVLADERKIILTRLLDQQKPNETETPSFAFLNSLRALNASKASGYILKAISQQPDNASLHNLLALSHIEQNQYSTAKVILLSLIARNEKTAAVITNLGVIAWLEGKPTVAEDYWNEAILMDNSKEASLNLGFLALRYRNGFEAKKHFERALASDDSDASAQVGMAVALLQNSEINAARTRISDLYQKFKSDPYARLSASYFLIDIDKKPQDAEILLSDYLERQDNDSHFRQALSETKRGLANTTSGMGLPTIDP